MLITIDFDNINEEIIYETFCVEGKEAEALGDAYLDLYELIGKDAMLKLFKHFHGDKIDCPMRLYRPEFIADLADQSTDRRERAKIARAGGYSAKVIESILSKRRNGNGAEQAEMATRSHADVSEQKQRKSGDTQQRRTR